MNSRRLYRCRHDRWLAGVAGGMAEYFEVDPTVVRVLWILSAFLGGVTILLYILLAFVMPPEPMPAAGMPGYAGMPGSPGAAGATGASTAGGTTPAGTPAGTAEGASGAAGTAAGDPAAAAGAADTAASGGIPGWTPPQGWDANAGWQGDAWAGHRHEPAPGRGNGRTGFALGILLVVFGAILLLGSLIPAWTAIGLGPAFILALGVALIVAATRRPASES